MSKSEMQHQYWITKKTVQRKLGSKEDEHVTSSDAELDAKIDIFRSISKTSLELEKAIHLYQDKLYTLSQEESMFGRFLKEFGNRSKTTGKVITNTGKAFTYCSQQRMCVRLPILRFQNEVNVFRARAICDMQNTLTSMEKERTQYRAALSWIKSVSMELDPDSGKGLQKFRAAQSHVRMAKQNFDILSMDSIQKIDLLAAARCNMFSHVLMSYMLNLKQFAQKTADTLDAISQILIQNPKYDFNVLKELTNHEIQKINLTKESHELDRDQSLFLVDDYVDVNKKTANELESKPKSRETNESLIKIEATSSEDILNLSPTCDFFLKPSEIILTPIPLQQSPSSSSSNHVNDKSGHVLNNKSNNSWIELFADLDPLSNLDAFDLLGGDRKNFEKI